MRNKLLILFATIALVLAVVAELGAQAIFAPRVASPAEVSATLESNESDQVAIDTNALFKTQKPTPPGMAIRYLALYDGLLAVSLMLMALGGFLSAVAKTHIRIQNISMLLASLADVILSFLLALLAFAALMAMVALLLAAPFGTMAYLVAFGFFDTSRAAQILTFIFIMKIVTLVLLVLAGQFNRRLILRLAVSLGLCVLVSFLHAFPPGFLVSIIDALAAILIAIVAFLFALPVLVGGILGLKSLA